MYLIDETYFIKDLIIPTTGGLDVQDTNNPFSGWIDKYARQLLQNALGNVLFDELDSHIEDGKLKEDADEKWKDLVTGKSYQYGGKSYKWKGLIFTEGTFKGSVLAMYTYYHWHLDQLSRMSGVGEVTGNAVNATNVNSTSRSVKVWNEYIDMYQGSIDRKSYNFSYINGIPFHDYFYNNESDYVSLLRFLSHNNDDYPNAAKRIEQEGYQNTMGL